MADVMRAGLDETDYIPRLHEPAEDRAFLAGLLWGADAWVAVRGDELAGFIAVAKGVVPTLYVHPSRQNLGLGARLLDQAREGRTDLELWCFQANEGARRFYENNGFRAVEFTDGAGNDEGLPDVRYVWRRDRSGSRS